MKNPLSTQALVDWLEKQRGTAAYSYIDNYGCLLCRYLKTAGLPVKAVDPYFWYDHEDRLHRLPGGWDTIAAGDDDSVGKTFGSALKRARKQLAREKAYA